jgi:hypothetical protein
VNPQYAFDVWAPPGGPWSDWVKPVLFAHVDPLANYATAELHAPALPWLARADGKTALVIDLPGGTSVALGLACASLGYRPVPLFNALPSPTGIIDSSVNAVCDVVSIIVALALTTPELDKLNLPFTAPPAFLLDAPRRVGINAPEPGRFDNRSVSLPTDFPSAATLASHGIRRAILIQENSLDPQADLAHTLLRWQQSGIEIFGASVTTAAAPAPIRVPKPHFFRQPWQRLLALMKLRRSPLGGFGGYLPVPSSGGGGVVG